MSDIDISQFLSTFFEEAYENLELLESGLLELDPTEESDKELVDSIFRAAHTIKGGAGSFGFKAISDFTHVMETLLDEVRDETRPITNELIELLLKAQDSLADLVKAAQEESEPDQQTVDQVLQKMELMLKGEEEGEPEPELDSSEASAVDAEPASLGWKIEFSPHLEMMHSGNDPLRILRELSALGEMKAQVNQDDLPRWSELHHDDCYLSWSLELLGEIDKAELDDIFLWVEDDCDLAIEPILLQSQEEAQQDALEPKITPESSSDIVIERRKSRTTESKEKGRRGTDSTEQSSIRVKTEKIDKIINQVGELVTTQSMLSNLNERFDPDDPEVMKSFGEYFSEAVDLLERHTQDLQEHVMSMRMLPVAFVFSRFGRTVHDLCTRLGKQVELKLIGQQTEMDKTVIEKIADPIMHLVRNSMDHGFEFPEEREELGKPAIGTLTLNAFHQGGSIYIEVIDDGRGLNKEKLINKAIEREVITPVEAAELSEFEIYQLIMAPGFSTADAISDVSGRGVGMDVVRQNIEELGGDIQIASTEGVGSKITIRLPLTLAIMDGQLVTVGRGTYVIPVVNVVESLRPSHDMINLVGGKGELLKFREQYIPIIRLHRVFDVEPFCKNLSEGILVVMEVDGQQFGVFVDSIFSQQQVAIKSIEQNFRRVDGVMGATILGDGSVALILDPPGISRMKFLHQELS